MPSSKRRGRAPEAARRVPLRKRLLFAVVTALAFFVALELVLWAVGVETVIEREDPFRGFSGLVKVFERDGDRYRTRPVEGYVVFNNQSFAAQKPPLIPFRRRLSQNGCRIPKPDIDCRERIATIRGTFVK